MKKSVFISSTYIDFKEQRKVIWQLPSKYDINILDIEQFGKNSRQFKTDTNNLLKNCNEASY